MVVLKPKKEITPEQWVLETKKWVGHRDTTKNQLAAIAAAQERAKALEHALLFRPAPTPRPSLPKPPASLCSCSRSGR
jgi:Holliday junction resolvasome RuvABC ATP-dependent DNA helicase subunit